MPRMDPRPNRDPTSPIPNRIRRPNPNRSNPIPNPSPSPRRANPHGSGSLHTSRVLPSSNCHARQYGWRRHLRG